MESFYTMNGRGDGIVLYYERKGRWNRSILGTEQKRWNCSSPNAKNGMTVILLRTERNGTERNGTGQNGTRTE